MKTVNRWEETILENNQFQDLEELGKNIQDIIDKAVNSRNYQKLNQTINQAVNQAVDTGSEAIKRALHTTVDPEHNARAYETRNDHGYQKPPFGAQQNIRKKEELPALYENPRGYHVSGVLKVVFGGILTGGMGIGLLTTLIIRAFGIGGNLIFGSMAVMGAVLAGGVGLLASGIGNMGKLSRFRRYVKALGEKTYCNLEELSGKVGKSVKYVRKDVRGMIQDGWFREGHMDKKETCLITSSETYRQYEQAQKQLEQRQKEQMPGISSDKKYSRGVQEVLDRGNTFLRQIRSSNDAIPGREISDKIDRMETIIRKIFERVQEHPEIIPDLKKLMNYYLPMTVKLLEAYEDMDRQPVQGENIRSSKREIEDTLDTLNQAFEKLLDSVFRETAMDISSDISVLHSLLAQEGLTEDDFARMKKETGKDHVELTL